MVASIPGRPQQLREARILSGEDLSARRQPQEQDLQHAGADEAEGD